MEENKALDENRLKEAILSMVKAGQQPTTYFLGLKEAAYIKKIKEYETLYNEIISSITKRGNPDYFTAKYSVDRVISSGSFRALKQRSNIFLGKHYEDTIKNLLDEGNKIEALEYFKISLLGIQRNGY